MSTQNHTSRRPLYRKIADDIALQISGGKYKPGQRIPSIRHYATLFGCNKLTVQKAFALLRRQGLIENRVGSGSYVRYPEELGSAGEVFDFKTDYIEVGFFPYRRVQEVCNELFNSEKARALAPVDVKGDAELIRVLSRLYHVPADRMIIISGAQQGLDLIAKLYSFRITDKILFEDPTYPGAISLFKARHFVRYRAEGPDPDELDHKLNHEIKLFYSMPAVHNPTGRSYSRQVREAVAARARRHGFYIIEDDYLSEFADSNLPRFLDLVPQNTIYIKSLSQTTVAGLRLGFMVVPRGIYDKILYAKFTSDIASNGLVQKFFARFIAQDYYRQHLKTVASKIAYRKEKLASLISEFDYLECDSNRQQGYSLWVKADRDLAVDNAPWRCGSDFSFDPGYRRYLRLSFMHLRDGHFEAALDYLRRIFSYLQ